VILCASITRRSRGADQATSDKVYLITPKSLDTESPWDKAIYCADVPFRGVCLDSAEYVRSRAEHKTGQYDDNFIKNDIPEMMKPKGFTISEGITIGVAGIATGIIIDQVWIKK
jgi:hypothetical protein